MGTRRRKVDASARQPTAPGKQAFFFFLVPRRSLTTHISNSTRQPSQAAGALFEKLADAARGHRPPRAAPDPPMQPIVLGKRSRAPEARKAPAPAAGDRRCAHGKAHNGYYCKACNGKGICEHGKNRSICRACGGSQLCAHGMQRNQCKECNSPCEHGRPRRRCEACGGARAPEARKAPAPAAENRRCAHGKAHNGYYCKECPGKGICEHGNNRSICGACGRARAPEARKAPAAPAPAAGDRRCAHGRANGGYLCRECPGKGICEHGRQRSHCKECGGSSYCEHGRQRHKCKECGGSSICEHGRERRRCKACWASQVCEHGRVRSVCEECRGGCVCEHGRRRSKCKECEASQICEHGRQRDTCKACKGSRTGHGEAVRRWRWPGDVAKDWNRCLHGYTRQTCCACAPREFRR